MPRKRELCYLVVRNKGKVMFWLFPLECVYNFLYIFAKTGFSGCQMQWWYHDLVWKPKTNFKCHFFLITKTPYVFPIVCIWWYQQDEHKDIEMVDRFEFILFSWLLRLAMVYSCRVTVVIPLLYSELQSPARKSSGKPLHPLTFVNFFQLLAHIFPQLIWVYFREATVACKKKRWLWRNLWSHSWKISCPLDPKLIREYSFLPISPIRKYLLSPHSTLQRYDVLP